jgi:adenine-specific DNA-methyltransferase
MARIEDYVAQVPDERLRNALAEEVRALKRTKKFGLVFEEHLPELGWLPSLSVKMGDTVGKRREPGSETWRVKAIRKGIATLENGGNGEEGSVGQETEARIDDLV